MTNVAVVLKDAELVRRFDTLAPVGMKYDAELGFAVQHLDNNNYLKGIAENNSRSLLQAMSNVAACGLTLNPAKKEAYLVPRKGKVCLDPSYVGLIKLATDSGAILWVQAKLVYSNDVFIMHGIDERPTHEYKPFGDRGALDGVYCVAKTKDGAYLTGTMSIDEVHAIRNRSEAYKSNPKKTPWFTDEGEMVKKTILKRESKLWPRTGNVDAESRLANAVQVSHENEEVNLVTSPDIGQYSDESKKYFDQVITQDDHLEMHVLARTLSTGEFTSLYNSFEKGSITKYKRLVDEMIQKGKHSFDEYVDLYNEYRSTDDQSGMDEITSEVSEAAFKLIEDHCGR